MIPILLVATITLAGCASGAPGLSSLGREANVTPLRGQPVEQLRQDDGESRRPICAMRLAPWREATRSPRRM